MLILLAGSLYFLYQNIPGEAQELDVSFTKPEKPPEIPANSTLAQFYPMMRFRDGDISYYIEETVDIFHQEEIYEYFKEEAESDSLQEALEELGEDEYTENEIRLVRIKFISDVGN